MQIGVGLTYWPWTALDEQVELARLADDVGFSSVWVSETWGQDAVGMLLFGPQQAAEMMAPLLRGLEKAGRNREQIDIAPLIPVAIDEDAKQARDAVRSFLAFYLGAMGSTEKNFCVDVAERHGFGESARLCQKRFLAGDRLGAEHAVSDGLVDLVALATTPSALPARLDEFRATGIDTLIAAPFGDRRAVLHHLSKYI